MLTTRSLESLLSIKSGLLQKLVLQQIKKYCKLCKYEQIKNLIRILIEIDDVQDGAINHDKAEILLDLF